MKKHNDAICPACGSYNKLYNDITINGNQLRCDCKEQKEKRRLLLKANIPYEYWFKDFNDYEGDQTALKEVKEYIQNLDNYYHENIGLFLYGNNGVGKTLMLVQVLREASRKKHSIFFVPYSKVITMLTNSWYDTKAKKDFERQIEQVDFLLVDDIGKAYHSQGGLAESTFENCLRYRSNPTLISSNKNVEEVRRMYEGTWGESIASLIYGKSIQIVVQGRDYRKDMSSKLKQRGQTEIHYRPLI